MNNTKSIIRNISIFVIALALYNLVIFAIPFEHTEVFWGAYIFAMLAILSQLGIYTLAFCGADTIRKKLYAAPVQNMGFIYLAVQLIVSLVLSIATTFMEDDIPTWIVYIIGALIFGVFTILILLVDSTRDRIVNFEEKADQQTIQVRSFRVNVDSILRRVTDPELKNIVHRLSETAKYSDPVSSEELYPVEAEITRKINELYNAVESNDIYSAKAIANEAIILFQDRNAQCKLYKKR